MTIVRNKQCNYNSRSAARGKFRLVENRLKGSVMRISARAFTRLQKIVQCERSLIRQIKASLVMHLTVSPVGAMLVKI